MNRNPGTHGGPDAGRWQALCTALGVTRDMETFDALIAAYSEPHRAYHNVQHLCECLEWFDAARELAHRPALVETALWFHDAVYEPLRDDNEARSADWARAWLREHGAGDVDAGAVHAMILATRTHLPAAEDDHCLLLDIDLAILGAPPERFREYGKQIREEYRDVPDAAFKRRRAQLLQEWLSRPHIYQTGFFRRRLDKRARDNLADALRKLT